MLSKPVRDLGGRRKISWRVRVLIRVKSKTLSTRQGLKEGEDGAERRWDLEIWEDRRPWRRRRTEGGRETPSRAQSVLQNSAQMVERWGKGGVITHGERKDVNRC